MSIPIFLPPVVYTPSLMLRSPISVKELCDRAKIPCRASGAWVERKVEIVRAPKLAVFAEPGDWGSIRIEAPVSGRQQRARLALAVLAYGLNDLVAKQSLQGQQWVKLRPPRGRPRSKKPLSTRDRQRRFREKWH